MYHSKYRSTSLSKDISQGILRLNSVSSVVNSFPGERKLTGLSSGTCPQGFCPGMTKFAPTTISTLGQLSWGTKFTQTRKFTPMHKLHLAFSPFQH